MGRKITMTGSNARYIEHRGYDAVPDEDREILMEGDEAEYQEHSYGPSESRRCARSSGVTVPWLSFSAFAAIASIMPII